MDVDQCPDVSGSCSIAAMPTFILFARGQEMARVTGANPAKLRELLQLATYARRERRVEGRGAGGKPMRKGRGGRGRRGWLRVALAEEDLAVW